MIIGVFDSGVGGLSVANAIEKSIPQAKVVLREDKKNLPYGNKTPEQLLVLVLPILEEMISDGCEVIVVACNTVTTNVIDELRQKLQVPLVGMEPMIKPASEITKSGVIAVFATPATLRSKRYVWLKNEYAKNITVVEPDCSKWALMIEQNNIHQNIIQKNVDEAVAAGADVIVLGCTHYHWIEDEIRSIIGARSVELLQPEEPVLKQLTRVLEQQL